MVKQSDADIEPSRESFSMRGWGNLVIFPKYYWGEQKMPAKLRQMTNSGTPLTSEGGFCKGVDYIGGFGLPTMLANALLYPRGRP
jgi:hypothetical protein